MVALEIVVLSNDRALRRELRGALAGRAGIRTVVTGWGRAAELRPATVPRIIVIDDEGCERAVAAVHAMRASEREAQIVYLAARHSIELEREVRRAGVSYYADKAATGRRALLAIEALLRAKGAGAQREESGIVQPGLEARKE